MWANGKFRFGATRESRLFGNEFELELIDLHFFRMYRLVGFIAASGEFAHEFGIELETRK